MPASPAYPPVTQPPHETNVSLEGGEVIVDGVAVVPKFVFIDHATSGNNTLVAAVTGKRIRVLSLTLVSVGALLARFESGADGTALSGQMSLAANGQLTLPFSPVGWFQTAVGALLNLELSAATSVDGVLVYIEV